MNTKPNLAIFCICIFALACQKPIISYETAINMCLPDTIRQEDGKVFALTFNRNCVLGAQLPDFNATTMDGKKIDKSYFEGKVSIINFWFEGCLACENEMPYFNKLVETYKPKNGNFLAIGRNSPKDISEFLVTHPYNFDQIAYGEPIIVGNFKMTWGYPTTLVIDKHLKIIYATGGIVDEQGHIFSGMDLTPIIDKALGWN